MRDPRASGFTPTKKKTIPKTPPGFTGLGGTFTPGGFVPTRPKVVAPPDQAPYRHGQSPAQQAATALASGGEVTPVHTGADAGAAQRAAHTMAVQRMLNAKGAHLAVDGQWGPATESAYRAFLQHGAQYTKIAQQSDARLNPATAPYALSEHEKLLMRQAEERRQREALAHNQPQALPAQTVFSDAKRYSPHYQGEPVAGWTIAKPGEPGAIPRAAGKGVYYAKPYYTDAHTHASTRGQVAATAEDTQFRAMFGDQFAQDIQDTPHLNPAFNAAVTGLAESLPVAGTAKKILDGNHNVGGLIKHEGINDLLWLGPAEIAAPFKITKGIVSGVKDGQAIIDAARVAFRDLRAQRLARATNPIIRRDLQSSVARDQVIAAIRDVPKLTGGQQRAYIAALDHNALTLSAQTGMKPSEAWARANFGAATFHDLNPTREQALHALGQPAHFQRSGWATLPTAPWRSVGMPKFYGKLPALIESMPDKVGVQELLGKIKSAGVKGDEIKWSRFDEFLKQAEAKGVKSVSKEEALSWLDKNYLMIEENKRYMPSQGYGGSRGDINSDETIFGQYTLPGGQQANYNEFTIRLPEDPYGRMYSYTGHFPDLNILAHVRTTDRTVAGDHSLMIEEIQSDWHQAGQKQGYRMPIEQHPDYNARIAALDEATQAESSALRALRVDGQQYTDIETNLHVNLNDRSSVNDLRDQILATDNYRGKGYTFSVKEENVTDRYGYNGDYSVTYAHLPGHDPVEVARRRGGLEYAQAMADRWTKLAAMTPEQAGALELKLADLNSAMRNREEKLSLMRALERDVNRGVADAPFQKTWHELAFKRMLQHAVENGYDRVAWTTGRTQAERYNLANFFKRIEIVGGGRRGSDEALYEWADEMARNSVDSASLEDLGWTDRTEEDLRQQAADYAVYPNEEDYYVKYDENGDPTPASPDDPGAELDETAWEYALEDYNNEVDAEFSDLRDQWETDARESMMERERDYYIDSADEWDSAPKSGDLTVQATDHNGHVHEYSASTDSSDDNALENVVGPDIATAYHETGQSTFEGDNLVAGENAKSALGASHFYDNKLTGFVNKFLKKTGVQSSKEQIENPSVYKIVDAQYRPEGSSPGHRFVVEDQNGNIRITAHTREEAERWVADQQRVNTGGPAHGVVVHSIPITNEVRAFVDQGLPLFQRDPLVKTIKAARMKGAVELGTDQGAHLHLFAAADASTLVHEMGHVIQTHLPEMADVPLEDFARMVERYFMTAKAPTKDLVLPFAELDSALRTVYGNASKVPGAKLTPKVKAALDGFFKGVEKEQPDVYKALIAARPQFQAAWGDHGPEDPMESGRGGPRNNADLQKLHGEQPKADPMLEAAAMQVDAGMPVDQVAQMFGVDEAALRAHIEGGGHAAEQSRILSNADVGSGKAITVDTKVIRPGNPDMRHVIAHLPDGREAGHITYYRDGDKWVVQMIRVPEELRRQGIGRQLFRAAERDVGKGNLLHQSDPSLLSPEGQAFKDSFNKPEGPQFQEGPPEEIPVEQPQESRTPEEILREGMKPVRFRRNLQNAARSDEVAARARAFEGKFRGGGGGMAGYLQAKKELKGALPKINYHGFEELDDEALDHLVDVVKDHPHLLPYQRVRLIEALDKATRGELPTASEQVLIEHVFGKDVAKSLEAISGLPGHLMEFAAEILNVPRSVMASFDLSAPFRQGLVIGTRHPVIFFRNFPAMLKAFGSERSYQALIEAVKQDPAYPMMLEAGLAITDMENLSRREEYFYSQLAERLTGGFSFKGGFHATPTRSPIRMSGRAYSGFLIKTRADVFNHLLRVAEHSGVDVQDQKFLKDLGRYINAATGRGNLHKSFAGAAPLLNTVFFSPRLLASRIDLLFSPVTYARAHPFVRRQALISMLHLAGVAGTILGLLSLLPDVTVNLDPRNADFGKVRVGNTRIDILGGFQQPVRVISQFINGKVISSTTGETLTLGPQGPGKLSRRDVAQRFFEGKLAPVPSVINDWMKGTNFQGQPFSWKKEVFQHMTPLLAQDAADLYSSPEGGLPNGILGALGGYAVGSIGFGIQTYGPKNPAKKPTDKLTEEAKKAGVSLPDKSILIAVDHKAHLDALSQQNENDPQGRLDAYLKYYAETTGDHRYDHWIGKKISDDAAAQGAQSIRDAMIGPGLGQYEQAIRDALRAQGKKW